MRIFISSLLAIYCIPLILSPSPIIADLSESNYKGKTLSISLLSDLSEVIPGNQFRLGAFFRPRNGWHIYWKFPGDSGLAPRIIWEIDNQSINSKIYWPVPEKISVGPLINYGYSDDVLLFSTLLTPHDLGEELSVSANIEWIACKKFCVPGSVTLKKSIPVSHTHSIPDPDSKKIFSKTTSNLPKIGDENISISAKKDDKTLMIDIKSVLKIPQEVYFIPDSHGQIALSANQRYHSDEEGGKLFIALPKKEEIVTKKLSGLLISEKGWPIKGNPKALKMSSSIDYVNEISIPQVAQISNSSFALFKIAFFAYIGGLLLNLMPCVFPILAIKVLSLIGKIDAPFSKRLSSAVSFSAGIILCCLSLMMLLLITKEAGKSIGWGFQLQSPVVIFSLSIIFTLIGLMLLGLLEIPTFSFGSRSKKNPSSIYSSFMSGVLTVVVATPCTAPFMATAITAAMQTTMIYSMSIFLFLALGIATPYVILSLNPKFLNYMPKPGAWMEILKEWLSVPMFITSIWLCWIFGKLVSNQGAFALIASCLLIGFACYFQKKAKKSAFTILLMSGFCVFLAFRQSSTERLEALWNNYEHQLIENHLAQGRPVFIDVTADWCITCKINKLTTLENSKVLKAFSHHNVALIRADWTKKSEEITSLIESHKRSGVPLNVLMHPNGKTTTFSPILTPQSLLKALEKSQDK